MSDPTGVPSNLWESIIQALALLGIMAGREIGQVFQNARHRRVVADVVEEKIEEALEPIRRDIRRLKSLADIESTDVTRPKKE